VVRSLERVKVIGTIISESGKKASDIPIIGKVGISLKTAYSTAKMAIEATTLALPLPLLNSHHQLLTLVRRLLSAISSYRRPAPL